MCQWALTQMRTLGAAAHLSWEILVSLRTAASAEAPLSPMLLPSRLRASEDGKRAALSRGVDAKANTRVAAHSRLEICVSLRTAASAEAPSSPMLLSLRL